MVSYEDGENLAREFRIPFFETSAVSDLRVDEAFMKLIVDCKERLDSGTSEAGSSGGSTSASPKKAGSVTVGGAGAADVKPKRSFC